MTAPLPALWLLIAATFLMALLARVLRGGAGLGVLEGLPRCGTTGSWGGPGPARPGCASVPGGGCLASPGPALPGAAFVPSVRMGGGCMAGPSDGAPGYTARAAPTPGVGGSRHSSLRGLSQVPKAGHAPPMLKVTSGPLAPATPRLPWLLLSPLC